MEIDSPPFARSEYTAAALYQLLGRMRSWLIGEQTNLRQCLRFEPGSNIELVLSEPEALPPCSTWDLVSVTDQAATLQRCQQIRLSWDHIVREYEDSWEASAAINKRLAVIRAGLMMLGDAFLSGEQREAQNEQQHMAAKEQQEILDEYFSTLFQKARKRKMQEST